MPNLAYKIDAIITKLKYKFNKNTKLNNFLKNKILFYIIFTIFLGLVTIELYIVITNTHHSFERWFYKNIYKIKHIENIILYGIYFTGFFVSLKFIKYLQIKYLKRLANIFTLNIVLYLGTIYLFTNELKTQILAIITPIILYGAYKIHNYIQETKSKYKFKFLIDSRYFFLIALVLLIYTPIFLYFEDKKIAENLSIYAYYALIIGVIYEIILTKFEK